MNRRSFLNAASAVGSLIALTKGSESIQDFVLDLLSPQTNRDHLEKVGVAIHPAVYSNFLHSSVAQFVAQLNEVQNKYNFHLSGSPKDSQILFTSPALQHQASSEMFFLSRLPGGLIRNDYQAWLRSGEAKDILKPSYEPMGVHPIYLALGPETHLQAFNPYFTPTGSKFDFITSNKNSWRRLNKALILHEKKNALEGLDALKTKNFISMEPLQPHFLKSFSLENLYIAKDTLKCSPQIYQAEIKNDFWATLSTEKRKSLTRSLDVFSENLNKYFEQMSPLANSLISKEPTTIEAIEEVQYQDAIISQHFIKHLDLGSKAKRIRDVYESYRGSSSIILG